MKGVVLACILHLPRRALSLHECGQNKISCHEPRQTLRQCCSNTGYWLFPTSFHAGIVLRHLCGINYTEFQILEGRLTCDHVTPMLDTSSQRPGLLGKKNDHDEPGFLEILHSALDVGHWPIQCLQSSIRMARIVKEMITHPLHIGGIAINHDIRLIVS